MARNYSMEGLDRACYQFCRTSKIRIECELHLLVLLSLRMQIKCGSINSACSIVCSGNVLYFFLHLCCGK